MHSNNTAATVLYGLAYSAQLVGALFAAIGLYLLYNSSSGDLHRLWADKPDVVLSRFTRVSRRCISVGQSIGLKIATILRLRRLQPVALVGTSSFSSAGTGTISFTGTGTATVVPPKFDPSKDTASQFDVLAEYALAARQLAETSLATIRRELQQEASQRLEADDSLTRKTLDLALSGYGAAIVGTVLLTLGICLELAANFS